MRTTTQTRARSTRKPKISPVHVHQWTNELFGEDLHAKRVLSLANGVTGVLHAATLGVHAIGQGLALATQSNPRHTVKQVDRLLSNGGVDPWSLFESWVPFVVGEREEIVVAIDWTDFAKDDHTTCSAQLVGSHGRTTPLVWKTVKKSELRGQRARVEDEVIERLHAVLDDRVHVTLIADRGFAGTLRYEHLALLGFEYVIRFREDILVTDRSGTQRTACDFIPSTGRATMLKGARLTGNETEVPAVVLVRKTGMKQAWCLATSRVDLSAPKVVELYAKRARIEEAFRDQKNPLFGFGLSATHINDCGRRDRLLLMAAMAMALLTLLGAASERVGFDRMLKVNTVKKRTHSLLRQGQFWFAALPTMREDQARTLMTAFDEVVREHAVFREAFGIL